MMNGKWNHRPPLKPRQPDVRSRTTGGLFFRCPAGTRALFFCGLVPLALLLLPACSKEITKTKTPPAVVRSCSPEADEALKGGDYEASVRLHEKLLEIEADNATALYHLGYTYGHLGRHEEEVAFYERAVSLGLEDSGLFFNFGMALGELNRMDKALLMFNRGLELDPDNVDTLLGTALAHQSRGDYRAAERAFIRVIDLDPKLLEARISLSLLYEETGRRGKALEQLRKTLEIDPHHDRALRMLRDFEKP